MENYKNFWLGIVLAAALAATGCGDDDNGGAAGAGGMPMPTGNVTAVHLAPEVPSADSTAVALFVDGAEATDLGTLEYSQSTGKIALPVGTYNIGIGLPGGDAPLLQLDDVELTEGADLVVVAYRTNEELPVDVFVFVNSTDGLETGSGRVFVGHGANDSALDPVNIAVGEDPDCDTLIPSFDFATTAPAEGVLDLAQGTYKIGFDVMVDDENACAGVGPVDVPVMPDVVSILIAVDENTEDSSEVEGALTPELWAIIPDAADPQPIRTIQTP